MYQSTTDFELIPGEITDLYEAMGHRIANAQRSSVILPSRIAQLEELREKLRIMMNAPLPFTIRVSDNPEED